MSGKRFAQEFKDAAVRQVLDQGHPVAEVAASLGIPAHSLYAWVRAARPPIKEQQAAGLSEAQAEIKRLERELRRTREERDILKKAAAYFVKDPD
jgi:transposase